MSNPSAANLEIEIKVRITDRATFAARLPELGFHLQTPETMERNMLFDTVDNSLRERKELLRIRRYGKEWLLTHKAEDPNLSGSLHKTRIETETKVDDGESLAGIFQRLGFAPVFTYEKYRTEWTDGKGHIVVDVTPIGDFAELEGDSTWIDETAA